MMNNEKCTAADIPQCENENTVINKLNDERFAIAFNTATELNHLSRDLVETVIYKTDAVIGGLPNPIEPGIVNREELPYPTGVVERIILELSAATENCQAALDRMSRL